MEKSTQNVNAVDPPNLCQAGRGRLTVGEGHAKVDAPMGPGGVVMLHVDGEHLLEVAPVPDQQPHLAFGPDRAHPALRECVRLGGPRWNLDYLEACGGEHRVEGGGENLPPVPDSNPGP